MERPGIVQDTVQLYGTDMTQFQDSLLTLEVNQM